MEILDLKNRIVEINILMDMLNCRKDKVEECIIELGDFWKLESFKKVDKEFLKEKRRGEESGIVMLVFL